MRRITRKKQAGWQREIAAAMALLFGLVLLHAAEPLLQVLGGLLAMAGGIPLIALAVRTLRQWKEDRATDFADAQRKVRKAQRREREAVKKERALTERGISDEAERKRLSAEAAMQRAAQEAEAAETRKRWEREQQIEAEARRWQMLPNAEHRTALTDLLRQRGMAPLPNPANETEAETELRFSGANRVALCLPQSRKAEPNDLERLNALRLKYKAAKAYLIAPAGFSPEAVRALPAFPALTFADAYILANWTQDFLSTK